MTIQAPVRPLPLEELVDVDIRRPQSPPGGLNGRYNGHQQGLQLLQPVGRCQWCAHHLFEGDRHGGEPGRTTRDCPQCAWCQTAPWRGGRLADGAADLPLDWFDRPPPSPRYLEKPARVDVVTDGHYWQDGGQFYESVPRSIWERWRRTNRKHLVLVPMNGVLVQAGGVSVLIDPGMGSADHTTGVDLYGHRTSRMRRSLNDLGLAPRDVDVVALSHAHYDHAAGIAKWWPSDGTHRKAFPKASTLVQAAAWEQLQSPTDTWQLGPSNRTWAAAAESKDFQALSGPAEAAPGVWLLPDGAHSPGHQVVIVNAGAKAIYPGDLAPTPEHLLYDVIGNGTIDRHAGQLLETRRRLLSWALGDWLWIFPHALGSVAGYFDRRRGRLTFIPAITGPGTAGMKTIDWTRAT